MHKCGLMQKRITASPIVNEKGNTVKTLFMQTKQFIIC